MLDVDDPGVLVDVEVLPTVVEVVDPPPVLDVDDPGVDVEVTVPLGEDVEVDPRRPGTVPSLDDEEDEDDDDDDPAAAAVLLVLELCPVLAQATPTSSKAVATAVTIPMILLN